MTIFYHVSSHMLHEGVFIPRVPKNRVAGEDQTIPRISVCTTIEECFSAMPCGNKNLLESYIERKGYFLVYRIDTDKLAIDNDKILTPEYLTISKLVPDATLTNEHWITQPFSIHDDDNSFMIKIGKWKETKIPLSDNLEHLEDKAEDVKYHFLRIHDLCYITDKVKKGQLVEFMFESITDKKEITDFINHNYDTNIKDVAKYKICAEFNQDTNIKQAFMLDSAITISRHYEKIKTGHN